MELKDLVALGIQPDQVVGGSVLVFAIWFIRQVWVGFKAIQTDRASGRKAKAEEEAARQAKVSGGFKQIDELTQRQMQQLEAEIKRLNGQIEINLQRHNNDVAIRDRQIAGLIQQTEALQENVLEGWDKGRGMEDVAHGYRHKLTNIFHRVWLCGKYGHGWPEELQQVYDAGKRGADFPKQHIIDNVPELQYVQRKPSLEIGDGLPS